MEKTIARLSSELGLPKKTILETYKAYWMSIKNKIESLPLLEDLDDQEFNELRQNFNIPNLGKLYCTQERYRNLKVRGNYVKKNYKGKFKNRRDNAEH